MIRTGVILPAKVKVHFRNWKIVLAAAVIAAAAAGCGASDESAEQDSASAQEEAAQTPESSFQEETGDSSFQEGMTVETAEGTLQEETAEETPASDQEEPTDTPDLLVKQETDNTQEEAQVQEESPVYTLDEDDIAMVLIDGLLYMDSSETLETLPDGLYSGQAPADADEETAENTEPLIILTSVGADEVPSRNLESNFGTGFTCIRGTDGQIYIEINGVFRIFRQLGGIHSQAELSPPVMTLVDPANDRLNGITVEASSYIWTSSAGGSSEPVTQTGLLALDAEVLQNKPLRVRGYQVPYTLGSTPDPDEITVRVYHSWDAGNAEAEPVSEDTYTGPYYLNMDPGRIYEIRAVWDEEHQDVNGFSGEAVYIVLTN